MVTAEKESFFEYINEVDLFKAYREVKNLLSDDEGYPVFLNIEHTSHEDSEFLPLRHRFVPYRDYCLQLHNIHGVTFRFRDLSNHALYFHKGDVSNKEHWFDFINTAKWCKECSVFIPSNSAKEICSVCNPDAPALRSLFQSGFERRFYNALVRMYTNLMVWGKVGLKDVFDIEILEKQVTKEEWNYLWTGHIDYLVVDNANHKPIVAFEIDGPQHRLDQVQRNRDKMKNRICNLGGLPLYRIPFEDLQNDRTEDQIMVRISETLKGAQIVSSITKLV